MPTLDWIGKKAVLNHHNEVPFHLLRCNPELSVGENGGGNLLVQGDNLLALKALLPYYAGQVKCIYIDPPYNTGNEGWVYNDNVNSPEIREWLGKIVGGETEDLSRHDKWLCMMYPRLTLLRDFLRNDGVILISIDDNEYSSLHLLIDEIFGRFNFVGTIIWKNVTDNNPTNISAEHEYVLCYAKNKSRLERVWKASAIPIKETLINLANDLKLKYPDLDERQKVYTEWFRNNKIYMWPFDRYKYIDNGGIYTGSQSVHNPGKEGYRYDVIHPVTGKPCQQPLMGYRFPEDTMKKLLSEEKILFGKDETKIIELKLYVQDYKAKLSSVFEMDTRLGANELSRIFPEEKRVFGFSKPSDFIVELLSFVTSPDSLILDSFAGSGTTGHAVFKLNKQDNGKRKFILVELDQNIACSITAVRLKRVIEGYDDETGFGGGFRFCELGPSLFFANGQIRAGVTFTNLAAHIFFTETGQPLLETVDERTPFLGIANGTAIYLLYNGVMRDQGNVLTLQTFESLPSFDGPKVIFGDGCKIGRERLRELNITFRQIPYEVKVR
jgi:adenine-specific DNA-methyltransferase